jgi:hypothetical protein
MFGKKKEKDAPPPPPPLPESSQIKQNIGNVSNAGMRNVGASMEPPPPPPLPSAPQPPAQQPPPGFDMAGMPPRQAKQLPATGYHRAAHTRKPSPPLFIKIDKYRELVQNIKELRSNALNLRDALDALTDIEKELRNGIAITQSSLDRFNSIISTLDSKLLKVGAEEEIVEVPREMDNYVKDLYDHVERIKHDLRTIKEE